MLGGPRSSTSLLLLAGAAILVAPTARADDAPAEQPPEPVSVSVKGEVGPELAPAAGRLVTEFYRCYPSLIERFEDPERKAPRHVTIIFKEQLRVPAYCTGDEITVGGAYLKDHPDDIALLTHELTHAVQQYPRARDGFDKPGWLVEGIADYARKVYGPERQPGWQLPERLSTRNNYDDGYRVSARFLEWLDERTPGAVDQIHQALGKGEYQESLFEDIAGKPVAELWDECVKALSAAAQQG
ncbi:basic secretory protein-like protein [Alienimonas chondri]|uniref:Plant Basic Secretory Protein n=1 Tax=Alienimonas chondri TaxID=2681879 RepID=A0ABX1VI51_9PLAN|nr:basic secretory protein-like protein [Alienimonas chondri]NNJ27558.1 hypothetical protein [Alienimonas chondri]